MLVVVAVGVKIEAVAGSVATLGVHYAYANVNAVR